MRVKWSRRLDVPARDRSRQEDVQTAAASGSITEIENVEERRPSTQSLPKYEKKEEKKGSFLSFFRSKKSSQPKHSVSDRDLREEFPSKSVGTDENPGESTFQEENCGKIQLKNSDNHKFGKRVSGKDENKPSSASCELVRKHVAGFHGDRRLYASFRGRHWENTSESESDYDNLPALHVKAISVESSSALFNNHRSTTTYSVPASSEKLDVSRSVFLEKVSALQRSNSDVSKTKSNEQISDGCEISQVSADVQQNVTVSNNSTESGSQLDTNITSKVQNGNFIRKGSFKSFFTKGGNKKLQGSSVISSANSTKDKQELLNKRPFEAIKEVDLSVNVQNESNGKLNSNNKTLKESGIKEKCPVKGCNSFDVDGESLIKTDKSEIDHKNISGSTTIIPDLQEKYNSLKKRFLGTDSKSKSKYENKNSKQDTNVDVAKPKQCHSPFPTAKFLALTPNCSTIDQNYDADENHLMDHQQKFNMPIEDSNQDDIIVQKNDFLPLSSLDRFKSSGLGKKVKFLLDDTTNLKKSDVSHTSEHHSKRNKPDSGFLKNGASNMNAKNIKRKHKHAVNSNEIKSHEMPSNKHKVQNISKNDGKECFKNFSTSDSCISFNDDKFVTSGSIITDSSTKEKEIFQLKKNFYYNAEELKHKRDASKLPDERNKHKTKHKLKTKCRHRKKDIVEVDILSEDTIITSLSLLYDLPERSSDNDNIRKGSYHKSKSNKRNSVDLDNDKSEIEQRSKNMSKGVNRDLILDLNVLNTTTSCSSKLLETDLNIEDMDDESPLCSSSVREKDKSKSENIEIDLSNKKIKYFENKNSLPYKFNYNCSIPIDKEKFDHSIKTPVFNSDSEILGNQLVETPNVSISSLMSKDLDKLPSNCESTLEPIKYFNDKQCDQANVSVESTEKTAESLLHTLDFFDKVNKSVNRLPNYDKFISPESYGNELKLISETRLKNSLEYYSAKLDDQAKNLELAINKAKLINSEITDRISSEPDLISNSKFIDRFTRKNFNMSQTALNAFDKNSSDVAVDLLKCTKDFAHFTSVTEKLNLQINNSDSRIHPTAEDENIFNENNDFIPLILESKTISQKSDIESTGEDFALCDKSFDKCLDNVTEISQPSDYTPNSLNNVCSEENLSRRKQDALVYCDEKISSFKQPLELLEDFSLNSRSSGIAEDHLNSKMNFLDSLGVREKSNEKFSLQNELLSKSWSENDIRLCLNKFNLNHQHNIGCRSKSDLHIDQISFQRKAPKYIKLINSKTHLETLLKLKNVKNIHHSIISRIFNRNMHFPDFSMLEDNSLLSLLSNDICTDPLMHILNKDFQRILETNNTSLLTGILQPLCEYITRNIINLLLKSDHVFLKPNAMDTTENLASSITNDVLNLFSKSHTSCNFYLFSNTQSNSATKNIHISPKKKLINSEIVVSHVVSNDQGDNDSKNNIPKSPSSKQTLSCEVHNVEDDQLCIHKQEDKKDGFVIDKVSLYSIADAEKIFNQNSALNTNQILCKEVSQKRVTNEELLCKQESEDREKRKLLCNQHSQESATNGVEIFYRQSQESLSIKNDLLCKQGPQENKIPLEETSSEQSQESVVFAEEMYKNEIAPEEQLYKQEPQSSEILEEILHKHQPEKSFLAENTFQKYELQEVSTDLEELALQPELYNPVNKEEAVLKWHSQDVSAVKEILHDQKFQDSPSSLEIFYEHQLENSCDSRNDPLITSLTKIVRSENVNANESNLLQNCSEQLISGVTVEELQNATLTDILIPNDAKNDEQIYSSVEDNSNENAGNTLSNGVLSVPNIFNVNCKSDLDSNTTVVEDRAEKLASSSSNFETSVFLDVVNKNYSSTVETELYENNIGKMSDYLMIEQQQKVLSRIDDNGNTIDYLDGILNGSLALTKDIQSTSFYSRGYNLTDELSEENSSNLTDIKFNSVKEFNIDIINPELKIVEDCENSKVLMYELSAGIEDGSTGFSNTFSEKSLPEISLENSSQLILSKCSSNDLSDKVDNNFKINYPLNEVSKTESQEFLMLDEDDIKNNAESVCLKECKTPELNYINGRPQISTALEHSTMLTEPCLTTTPDSNSLPTIIRKISLDMDAANINQDHNTQGLTGATIHSGNDLIIKSKIKHQVIPKKIKNVSQEYQKNNCLCTEKKTGSSSSCSLDYTPSKDEKRSEQKTNRRSLIPRKQNPAKPTKTTSALRTTSRPPASSYVSRTELNQEIQRLGSLCEARTKELNLLKMKLKHAAMGFDAFSVLVKYLTEELDALSHPQLLYKLRQMKEEHVMAEKQLRSYQEELQGLKQQHANEIAILSQKIKEAHRQEIIELHNRHSEELRKVHEQHEEEISKMIEKHLVICNDTEEGYIKTIEQIKEDFLIQKEEILQTHSKEFERAEQRHQEAQASLADHLDVLQKEYNSLHVQARQVEEALQKDTDTKIQWISLKKADLEKEVDSLKAVLEMKRGEIHALRKENMEMKKELEELPMAKEKIKMLQARAEDLQALVEEKVRVERQLSSDHQVLKESFEKEYRVNKRLSMEKEELVWRLKQNETNLNLKSISEPASYAEETEEEEKIEKAVSDYSPSKSPAKLPRDRPVFFTYATLDDVDSSGNDLPPRSPRTGSAYKKIFPPPPSSAHRTNNLEKSPNRMKSPSSPGSRKMKVHNSSEVLSPRGTPRRTKASIQKARISAHHRIKTDDNIAVDSDSPESSISESLDSTASNNLLLNSEGSSSREIGSHQMPKGKAHMQIKKNGQNLKDCHSNNYWGLNLPNENGISKSPRGCADIPSGEQDSSNASLLDETPDPKQYYQVAFPVLNHNNCNADPELADLEAVRNKEQTEMFCDSSNGHVYEEHPDLFHSDKKRLEGAEISNGDICGNDTECSSLPDSMVDSTGSISASLTTYSSTYPSCDTASYTSADGTLSESISTESQPQNVTPQPSDVSSYKNFLQGCEEYLYTCSPLSLAGEAMVHDSSLSISEISSNNSAPVANKLGEKELIQNDHKMRGIKDLICEKSSHICQTDPSSLETSSLGLHPTDSTTVDISLGEEELFSD